MGIVPLLNFAALLSLNLAIINLLPVPALDGGHFLTLCVEAVRGKPLSPKVMHYIQNAGVGLIILLMLLAMKNVSYVFLQEVDPRHVNIERRRTRQIHIGEYPHRGRCTDLRAVHVQHEDDGYGGDGKANPRAGGGRL